MVATGQNSLDAQEPDPSKHSESGQTESNQSKFNIPTPTMGGKQLWTDWIYQHGYRIQQNVLTGHYRLLSPQDFRLAWGTKAACKKRLDSTLQDKSLGPMTGRVVIVLHGLTRTRGAMTLLENHIQQNSDIQVANIGYASTRTSIDEHARALASVIEHMPGVDEISFLGHSMGNIVVRYYLGTINPESDPRFHRMVMLGPPNHGSRLASVLKDNLIFKTFWGTAGQQLSERGWDDTSKQLATPSFEFGVIAGASPESSYIENPWIEGDNDLVVTVDEARLIGGTDFYQQDLWHSTMMRDESVLMAALTFLEHGYFVSEADRKPIKEQP